MIVAAKDEGISEIFHILARYFYDTRGSLNFLAIDCYSQNLPLIIFMSA